MSWKKIIEDISSSSYKSSLGIVQAKEPSHRELKELMQKRSLNLMKFLNATCLTNTVTTTKFIDDLLLDKLSKAQFLNKLR